MMNTEHYIELMKLLQLKYDYNSQDHGTRYSAFYIDIKEKYIWVYANIEGIAYDWSKNKASFLESMTNHPLYKGYEIDEHCPNKWSFYFHFPKTKEFLKFIKKDGVIKDYAGNKEALKEYLKK